MLVCHWDERRNIEWKVDWLIFSDDTVVLGDSEEKTGETSKRIWKSLSKEELFVNKTKSKIMNIGNNGEVF